MEILFSGKQWSVDRGFNLYIDISTACDARCPFCIAPSIGRENGPGFFDGALAALDLAETVRGSVQIIGGEPTISKRLPPLLREIGCHPFHRIVVNTNGSNLSDRIVTSMLSARTTYVNVSRHHYLEDMNRVIMRFRSALPNATIADGIRCLSSVGIIVRMQCNLVLGCIDSLDEMLRYIDWCASLGCANISFSQLFPLGLFDYNVPMEPGYTEDKQVDLRKITMDIDNHGGFVPTNHDESYEDTFIIWGRSGWSSSKRRFWYAPNGALVSLKTLSGFDSDGLPSPTEYDKASDPELRDGLLAFAVLHPDGRVTASWDRRERMIFDPTTKYIQEKTLCA